MDSERRSAADPSLTATPGGAVPARLPEVVRSVSLSGLLRIDAGLEGDWSDTVVPVWTRERGHLGFDGVTRSHSEHRPSLELYYEGAWVGIHCFRRRDGNNVFDEELARQIVLWVEGATVTGG